MEHLLSQQMRNRSAMALSFLTLPAFWPPLRRWTMLLWGNKRLLLELRRLIRKVSKLRMIFMQRHFVKQLDALFQAEYPQTLATYFCSLGTNPKLGFQWAGTTAEQEAGLRVEREMKEIGLANVRREAVPVDVFEFIKSEVFIDGRRIVASTFTGVPPTGPQGITADVVYAKDGTATDFDAVGNVVGKIVLIDNNPSKWWPSWPAYEASHRRAAGIMITSTHRDSKYYAIDPTALGSFDGEYDMSCSPWVYISQKDGDWIKSKLASGPVSGNLLLEEKVTLAKDGGQAHNILGELPGTSKNGDIIVWVAHQDSHFRSGTDDTAGLVSMLSVAKAMKASGYCPSSTMVFLASAAEEGGYANSYYDWLVGSTWAVTHAHQDWVGKTRAVISFDSIGQSGCPVDLKSSPELRAVLGEVVKTHPGYLLYGFKLGAPDSWNDQWSFSASGIPSVEFETTGGNYLNHYHFSFGTFDRVNWSNLHDIGRYAYALVLRLDEKTVPYEFKARGEELDYSV